MKERLLLFLEQFKKREKKQKVTIAVTVALLFLISFVTYNAVASSETGKESILAQIVGSGETFFGNVGSVFQKSFSPNRKFIDEISLTSKFNENISAQNINSISDNSISSLGNTEKSCSFETDQSSSKKTIIFNEIAWMGDTLSSQNEWIELKNISKNTLDISEWQIVDQDEKMNIFFPKGTVIKPNAFYLLARSTKTSSVRSDSAFKGSIRNSEEGLRLFGKGCVLHDEVFADSNWPGGNVKEKKTMERNEKTLEWYTSSAVGGSPGRENLSPLPNPITQILNTSNTTSSVISSSTNPTSNTITTTTQTSIPITYCSQTNLSSPSHRVLINEVAWAGVASDKTSDEWIELKENTGSSVSMAGWQMLNKGGTIKIAFDSNHSIQGNGYFLLERTDDETVPNVKADVFFTGSIKNSDESLRLFNEKCQLVDEVVANADWPAGISAPEYRTMERSTNLSWHTYAGNGTNGIFGTPRAQNSELLVFISPPPPPTPKKYTVTISKTGDGNGTVQSSSGISCGDICAKEFEEGVQITLSGVPDTDSNFGGWLGDCIGANECALTFQSNRAVTAQFTKIPPPPSPSSSITNALIYEIQIAGTIANDEYITLFNPSDQTIDISSWSIQYRGSSASSFSKKNFEIGSSIPSKGTFQIAHRDFIGSSTAQMVHSSFALSGTGGTILLVPTNTLLSDGNDLTIIDKVAYGSGSSLFPEGSAYEPAPLAGSKLRRKIIDSIPKDTNNNIEDFETL